MVFPAKRANLTPYERSLKIHTLNSKHLQLVLETRGVRPCASCPKCFGSASCGMSEIFERICLLKVVFIGINLESLKHDSRVLSSKAEVVTHNYFNIGLTRHVRHVVEIALGIGLVEVNRRGN